MIIRNKNDEGAIYQASHDYLDLKILPSDVVLDIGAHIGGFAEWVSQFKPSQIFCVEPTPNTFAVLEQNAAGKGWNVMHAAVGTINGNAELFVTKRTGATMNSTVRARKGDQVLMVPMVAFVDLLEQIQPTVLKVDCEGAEFSFLYEFLVNTNSSFSSVRQLAMEYHIFSTDWYPPALAMHQALLLQGFEAVKEPRFKEGKEHLAIAVYRRP